PRIDMPRAADLPNQQWAPGVEKHIRCSSSHPFHKSNQRGRCHALEAEHDELHGLHGRRKQCSQPVNHLSYWRIDCVCVVAPVDVLKYFWILRLKNRERAISRHISIWTDVGVLHNSVPHISVNIRRKIRLREETYPAHGDGESKRDP